MATNGYRRLVTVPRSSLAQDAAGGPGALILVRHAESVGNVLREEAEAAGAATIPIPDRDADVGLTGLGESQAAALGRWLADLPDTDRPTVVWTSPYRRAVDTTRIALLTSGLDVCVHVDERLRDRELGILDRLTAHGIRQRFPDEAERRQFLGKFYYRPPGGESWADVVLRLRSVLVDITHGSPTTTPLVVSHDSVTLLLRYVLERMDEGALLDIARVRSVGNASVTRLLRAAPGEPWAVDADNAQHHLIEHGSVPTQHEADHDVDPA